MRQRADRARPAPSMGTRVMPQVMYRQEVDATQRSALVVCSCGARHLTTDRAAAWRWAHQHALAQHPGQDDGTSRRRAGDWR